MSQDSIPSAPPEIPADDWRRIANLPGDDPPAALAAAYFQASHNQGIAILAGATVQTAFAAVLATMASSGNTGPRRTYIVDSRRPHLSILFREFCRENLANEVTLYHGSLAQFFRDIPLLPNFICIDAATPHLNVLALRNSLPAGVAVLLLAPADGSEALTHLQACVNLGLLGPLSLSQDAVLYQTTNSCSGVGLVLNDHARLLLQGRLHERYFLSTLSIPGDHTPVADLTEEIRRDFALQFTSVSGYGKWPHVDPDKSDLPAAMPDGRPWPKISIVTPSFNQGRYIEETILSVLHQGYPDVEHIIIDGGSTDETRLILQKYKHKVAHVVSELDNGQSHAINKGMAFATGEILTWLNSDDRLAPGALAAVALAFHTSGADMVAGICRLYRDGELERQHLTACADGPLPLENLLDLDSGWNAGQFFYQPEVMFTRDLWLRAGGHVNDWLHYSMDYEMWLRFAEAGARIHVIGRPVAWFRLHDEQKTHVAERFQSELVLVRDGFLKTRGLAAPATTRTDPPRETLRITFLNDHGAFFGAGIAHVRMTRAVARAGHDVTLISVIDRPKYGMEVPTYTVQSVVDRVAASRPDLVIVGNLHNAEVEPLLLHFLCERFPTLLMMHDFWVLTGRCAYPNDCEKYLNGCDETCPTADEYPALAPSKIADAWKKKRLILYADHRPALLANSSWASALARDALNAASIANHGGPSIERFHLSFPLEIFRPRDRRTCRDAFRLPHDSFIVLLPAALEDPRKGGWTFLEALGRLGLPNLLVVTIGPIAKVEEPPVKLLQLGFFTDPYQIACLNSAADVVAAPSSAETFGQVFIESIACGTPVVGYPVSGIREALQDGITGVLAADTNPASLAAAVQFLYTHPDLRGDLSRWGRIYVENEWSEFSAYRHLFTALHAIGLASALNLRRNIRFLPNNPVVPPIQSIWQGKTRWVPLRGFSAEERAPQFGLDSFWWILAPTAIAEIFAAAAGPHQVLISYRNSHEQQRLKVRCNGVILGTFNLVNTGFDSGRLIVLDMRLELGPNQLHFEASRWFSDEHDTRQLAIIVTEILVEPAPVGRTGDLSPEQMLSRAWGHLPQ